MLITITPETPKAAAVPWITREKLVMVRSYRADLSAPAAGGSGRIDLAVLSEMRQQEISTAENLECSALVVSFQG